MRRIGGEALACLALVLAVASAACGRAPADRAAIRLIGEPSATFSALIDLKAEYQSAAGVRVETAAVDRAGLMAALARDAEAPPDLAVVPHYLLGRLATDHAIHPIKSLIDDLALFDPRVVDPQIDLVPWWRELSEYHHQIYGYPVALRDLRKNEQKPTLFFSWLAFAYAAGARIMDAPSGDAYGAIVVNSPEAIKATDRFLASEHLAVDALYPSPDEVERPAVPIAGYTLVIPSRARHAREAFRVMQQMLSNDVQAKMARRGVLSPRKSAVNDSTLIDAGVPMPTVPEAQAIIDTMTPILASVVSGKLTARQGLDLIAVQLETVLAGKAMQR